MVVEAHDTSSSPSLPPTLVITAGFVSRDRESCGFDPAPTLARRIANAFLLSGTSSPLPSFHVARRRLSLPLTLSVQYTPIRNTRLIVNPAFGAKAPWRLRNVGLRCIFSCLRPRISADQLHPVEAGLRDSRAVLMPTAS